MNILSICGKLCHLWNLAFIYMRGLFIAFCSKCRKEKVSNALSGNSYSYCLYCQWTESMVLCSPKTIKPQQGSRLSQPNHGEKHILEVTVVKGVLMSHETDSIEACQHQTHHTGLWVRVQCKERFWWARLKAKLLLKFVPQAPNLRRCLSQNSKTTAASFSPLFAELSESKKLSSQGAVL